jgi:hypothetical protein
MHYLTESWLLYGEHLKSIFSVFLKNPMLLAIVTILYSSSPELISPV